MAPAPAALAAAAITALDGGHRYCIVGAGPAGIQLGHFLKHAGRDYVIYERSHRAGSFFREYPRHRKLISLNKRFVREGRSAEFAFRHDWNSLIDVRPMGNRTRPMTQRSKELFPHADVLAEYLADFAQEQEAAIQYETTVKFIQRPESGSGFLLQLERPPVQADAGSATAETVHCHEVVVATGFWRPRGVMARVDGAAHVEGYEDLPESGEAYEGKSVAVLGLGNAALETVQELQKYTAEVHLLARRRPLPEGGGGVRFAYQTHYVGDIRAGRTTILDTYLLKSLDTFDFTAFDGIKRRLLILQCQGARRCVWTVEEDDCADSACHEMHSRNGQGLDYWVPLAMWREGSSAGKRVTDIFLQHAPEEEGSGWKIEETSLLDAEDELPQERREEWEQARRRLGIEDEVFSGSFVEVSARSSLLRALPGLLDALVPIRATMSMDNLRHPLDHVIRCFGWAMDTSVFDTSLAVNVTHGGKYPELLPTFEAVGVPGLYFAGTLAHGLDFRKSAGGFIHGFRYTARALFRLLEERNFGKPWPHSLLPLRVCNGTAHGVGRLARTLQHRINEASGPYQMFGSLGDVVVFEPGSSSGEWAARYLEEVPLAHASEEFRQLPYLAWIFRYGEGFHGPQVLGYNRVGSTSAITAFNATFLHPHLSFHPTGETEPSMRHWISEDIFTHWDSDEVLSPLERFLARVVAAATGEPAFASSPQDTEQAAEGSECSASTCEACSVVEPIY